MQNRSEQNRSEQIKNLSKLNENLQKEIHLLQRVNFLKQFSVFAFDLKRIILASLVNISKLLAAYVVADLSSKGADCLKTEIDNACVKYFNIKSHKSLPFILESELLKTKNICLDIREQLANPSVQLISKNENEFESTIPRAKL